MNADKAQQKATFLTVRQLAAALGCAVSTVQRWRAVGVYGCRLEPQRTVGCRVWFTLIGVADWQAEVEIARRQRYARLTPSVRAERAKLDRQARDAMREIERQRARPRGR